MVCTCSDPGTSSPNGEILPQGLVRMHSGDLVRVPTAAGLPIEESQSRTEGLLRSLTSRKSVGLEVSVNKQAVKSIMPSFFVALLASRALRARRVNRDPHNEGITIDDETNITFMGQTLKFEGGSTKCARTVLRMFDSNPDLVGDLSGKHILEVGSGTGLVGFVVELLEHNARSNLTENQLSKTRCFELLWGKDPVASLPSDSPPYDAIFGVDLIYAKEVHELLLETFWALGDMGARPPTVYLAYIKRFPWESRFFELMDMLFQCTLAYSEDGIEIFKFTPRDGVTWGSGGIADLLLPKTL